MDTNEVLDREVIVERAEAVRSWLAGLALSNRALGALDRELAGIIADDPGGYINGRRPLAGLTIDDLIAELSRPNAGAVGQVRGVGDRVIADLRAVIAPDGELAFAVPADATPTQEPAAPAAEPEPVAALGADGPIAAELAASTPDAGTPAVAEPAALAPELDAPAAAEPAAEAPPRRPRGRPRKTPLPPNGPLATASTDTPLAPPGAPQATAPARAPRLRPIEAAPARPAPTSHPAVADPGLSTAPAQPAPVPAPGPDTDATLEQLARLWPTLHPQARRAVVLYVSMLLVEI